jgi:2-dehydropantoate 2-reductase
LIVTVKAGQTVGALLAIKNRLGPESSILFLQNGVGIIDQVDEEAFPDPSARPEYMVGIVSHGVNSQGPFEATHAGFGTIAIGLPIRPPTPSSSSELPATNDISASSQYILRTICRAPVLAAVAVSPTEILQAQLEKLAVNAILNPMTALIDARNGAILYNYSFTRAQRLLLAEISLVIRSLPELKPHPNLATRFSAERLESMVVAVAKKTADNISSMLADVRQGKKTEIDYINGYIVKRGEELGITCFMNYLMMQLVKGKQNMVDRERYEELPLARSFTQQSPK